MRLTFVVLLPVLSILVSDCALAQVKPLPSISKERIIADIEAKYKTKFQKRVGRLDSATRVRLQQRSEALAKTLNAMPTGDFDVPVAQWITESTIEFALMQRIDISSGSDKDNSDFTDRLNKIKSRLVTLDAERGRRLCQRRNNFVSGNEKFDMEVLGYICRTLQHQKAIEVSTGPSAFAKSNDGIFDGVALGIKISQDGARRSAEDSELSSSKSPVSDSLTNELATLALVYEIRAEYRRYSRAGQFGYGNLYSSAYDDGSPALSKEPKPFSAATSAVKQLINQCVHQTTTSANIDLTALRSSWYMLDYIRLGKTPPALPNVSDAPTVIVRFQNVPGKWELISAAH